MIDPSVELSCFSNPIEFTILTEKSIVVVLMIAVTFTKMLLTSCFSAKILWNMMYAVTFLITKFCSFKSC